jgi:hydrogenase nickel incorporation protein HypA/HybF
MHELSVAVSLIEAVEEEALRHGGKVQAVHVRLGPLSGIVKEALLSAFDAASADTVLAGAKLLIEEVGVVIYCRRCLKNQPVTSMQWMSCPECGDPAAEVLQGRELELTALEVE